ncbi:F-box/kelch-repeat protein At3g23880-like [Coffea arabica]|uniref:F-box/kelch-repeat protein At3g23880-like n=1 Tax=Coffea arabica TaxID=13443 RepID=A0A6P6WZZ0_COFAR|nr:F-box/kelch-repeat protein At3g23880-like [Coffea arabica]
MNYSTYDSIPRPINSEDLKKHIQEQLTYWVCIATQKRHLFLWNPSNRKYKRLPDSGLEFRYTDSTAVHSCLLTYGFGHDELHDDYKVVANLVLCLVLDPGEQVVKVFTQRTNSWERNQGAKHILVLQDWRVTTKTGGTFSNDKLHWTPNSGSYYHRCEKEIVSLDLANESSGEVELTDHMGQPKYPRDHFYRWTIGGFRERCLACFVVIIRISQSREL